jgi:hypothetical protein
VDFLRLMPQKIPDYWAAFGVCRVKNRLIGDFWGFTREAQQTPSQNPFYGVNLSSFMEEIYGSS